MLREATRGLIVTTSTFTRSALVLFEEVRYRVAGRDRRSCGNGWRGCAADSSKRPPRPPHSSARIPPTAAADRVAGDVGRNYELQYRLQTATETSVATLKPNTSHADGSGTARVYVNWVISAPAFVPPGALNVLLVVSPSSD